MLTLAMMLSVMVMNTGAAFSDQSSIDTKHTEAVDMCVTLNIINGFTDGSFKPNGDVTRAQMCKMICVAMNGGKEPALGSAATSSFTDVATSHWASPYIESCVSQGIVAGVGNGKFNPDGNVTATQAAKMLLIALGYDADTEGLVGTGWDIKTNVLATQRGLYEDLEDIDVTVALSREHAAEMIWNTLQATEVDYDFVLSTDANGTLVSTPKAKDVTNYADAMADWYGVIDNQSAIMTDWDYDSDKGEWTYYFAKDFELSATNDDRASSTDHFTSDQDYTDLFRHNVKVVFDVTKDGKVDNVYGMYADKSVSVVSGILGDIDGLDKIASGDQTHIFYKDKKIEVNDTKYKVETNDAGKPVINGYEFGVKTQIADIRDFVPAGDSYGTKGYEAFAFDALDTNDNGKIDTLVVYPFIVGEISYVGSDTFTVKGISPSYDFDDCVVYDGMAKDDWVIVTKNVNTSTRENIVEQADVISGEVTVVNGSDYTIDADTYTVANRVVTSDLELTNDVDAVVVNGYIFNAEKTSGNLSIDEVLYVNGVEVGSSYGQPSVTARVVFVDGTTEEVNVTSIDGIDLFDGKKWNTTDKIGGKSVEDAITAAAAANAIDGLWAFEEDDGDYELSYITYGSDDADFDNQFTDNSKTKKTGDDRVAGQRVNDDAVIFVVDGDGDVSVLDGATVAGWAKNTNTKMDSVEAYANTNSGYNYVELALIVMDNGEDVPGSSANDVYGYVVKKLGNTKEDGTNYTSFSVWTGAENETFKVKTADVGDGVAKGKFVKISGGEIKVVGKAAAVKAVDSDSVSMYVMPGPADEFNITSDTKVIYVNTKDVKGVEGGSIEEADDMNTAKYYESNVVYVIDPDDSDKKDLAVLFVDVNNELDGDTSGDYDDNGPVWSVAAVGDTNFTVPGTGTREGTIKLAINIPSDWRYSVSTQYRTSSTDTWHNNAQIFGGSAPSYTVTGTGAAELTGTETQNAGEYRGFRAAVTITNDLDETVDTKTVEYALQW